MAEKAWDGRFSEKTDKSVEKFTSSIEVDQRLYPYDIEGSIAHCMMLARTSVISEKDAVLLIEGLKKIRQELDQGLFKFDDSLEDIHMHIETRLAEKIGGVARKLHTARSRNDQVALDVRMYLRDKTSGIIKNLNEFQKVIIDFAETHIDTVMPGYTHLQRAQPVLLAHHLLAYYEMLERDTQRLTDSLKRTNIMPLGAAALAGTTYPIDRAYTAELLDFPVISSNSIDSVSDRDFIIEFLTAAGICMMHLSRLSEELILWSSSEFSFIELPDSFATGSSIMPQKKNPDVPELVRGKTGKIYGNLMAMLTVMKSLPLAYNRDMQEDKSILFDSVDTLKACVEIFTKMLPHIKVFKNNLKKAASTGFLNATDMADYLVTKGMPFREAHSCVGRAVGYALEKKKELDELTLSELQSFSELIKEDIFKVLTINAMVDRRKSFGGTAPGNVREALNKAKNKLNFLRDH